MNAFARYLFQGMFSWVQEAVRQLSDPGLIDSWLATHWLAALIPLLIIGTVIDFAVWMIRWQPYRVWRSSMRRPVTLLSQENRELRRFRKGFGKENAEISAIARPLQDAPVPEEILSYTAQPEQEEAADDAYYDWQFAQPAQEAAEQPPVRHRRSDRYRRGVRAKEPRRTSLLASDDTPIDGLPPIMTKEEAFRAPVYPHAADQEDDR